MNASPSLIKTAIPEFTLRAAVENDAPLILQFIRELAEFEKLSDQVVATEEKLRSTLFGERREAEVILGLYQGEAVAFALYFHTYSTFLAQPGLYLEDLFVRPAFRSKGFGQTMLAYLAKLALERGCGRFEWSVLDWNQRAVSFYEKLGAQPKRGWTLYRLTGSPLGRLAARSMAVVKPPA